MDSYRDKNILIVGMARSGIGAGRLLHTLGANVYINDMKSRDKLGKEVEELEGLGVGLYLGVDPYEIYSRLDMLVLSPGVPYDLPLVKRARDMGIEVIGELELSSRLCRAPIIAITGTNGKTTTTMLVGEIMKASGRRTHVVGNIGVPFIDRVMDIEEDDIVVLETSSYQLESIVGFRPYISAILNISEDHLDRHKTMENYIGIKGRIFENQSEDDYMVLNADDSTLDRFSKDIGVKTLMFSRERELTAGAWIEKGHIVIDLGRGKRQICAPQDLFILGEHNLENALAATIIASIMGVETGIISKVLREFKGVEHRIEHVATIDEIDFYNDSKGTNPDATIKAIDAMKGPTIIIAGGMDEDAHFDSLIDAFRHKVRHMVVLGETSDKLIFTAHEKGFFETHRAEDLDEAVLKAFSLANKGDNILLSPACASFDMFTSYEERGKVFKRAVKSLRG